LTAIDGAIRIKLNAAIGATSSAVRRVDSAITGLTVEIERATPSLSPVEKASYQDRIKDAQAAVAAALALQSRGQVIASRVTRAPDELHNAVDEIIGLVNKEIDKAEPSMTSVEAALSQQKTLISSPIFPIGSVGGGTVKNAKMSAEKMMNQKNLRNKARPSTVEAAMTTLSDALDELDTVVSPIADALQLGDDPPPIRTCVDAAQGSVALRPFEITRSNTDPISPGGSTSFIVTGGDNVRIAPTDEAKANLQIRPTGTNGVIEVSVSATATAKPGSYVIEVVDNRNQKVVIITVKPAA
jgi:hypothetical protein